MQTECPIEEIFNAIENRAAQLRLELSYLIAPVSAGTGFKLKCAAQQMNSMLERHHSGAVLIGPLFQEVIKPLPRGVGGNPMQYSEDTAYWFMRLNGQHIARAMSTAAFE